MNFNEKMNEAIHMFGLEKSDETDVESLTRLVKLIENICHNDMFFKGVLINPASDCYKNNYKCAIGIRDAILKAIRLNFKKEDHDAWQTRMKEVNKILSSVPDATDNKEQP